MAKPAVVQRADELLALIEKCDVLTPSQLEQARTICGNAADAVSAARRLVKDEILSTWQARQLVGGFSNLRIGKYKLVNEFGGSGLGRIFVADHAQMGRRAMLKLLPRRDNASQDTTDRWLAKARELAALDHRNIVHLFDVDLEGDRYFLVMEWVPGNNLTQQVAQSGPLSFSNAADIARQIASGLAHAHALGLLHLSLSPDQVLIDPKGTVKLLDVGITSLQSQDLTGTKNKPAMKPDSKSTEETAKLAFFESTESAAQAETDFRSDLFSLGRILYFALAGKTPDANGPIPPITTVRPDTPEALVQLIERLTAADRGARGDSAEEAEQVLVEFLKSAPKDSIPSDPRKTTEAASGAKGALPAEAKTAVATKATPASPDRSKPVAATPGSKSEPGSESEPGSKSEPTTQRQVDTPDATKEADDPFNAATLVHVKSVYSSGSNPILTAQTETSENTTAQGSSSSKTDAPQAGDSSDNVFEIRVKTKKRGSSKSSPAKSSPAKPSTAKAAVDKTSVAGSSASHASAASESDESSAEANEVALKPRSGWSRVLLWTAVPLVGLAIGAGVVVLLLHRDSGPKPVAIAVNKPVIEEGSGDQSKSSDRGERAPLTANEDNANPQPPENDTSSSDTSGTNRGPENNNPDSAPTTPAAPNPNPPAPTAAPVDPNVDPNKDQSVPAPTPPAPTPPVPTPPAPAATPAAPTPPANKPPMPDPFAEFPKYATLPTLPAAGKSSDESLQPGLLAKLLVEARAFCIIHLHGGETALPKPRQKFELKEVNDRQWTVLYRDGGESGGIEMAQIRLQEQQLLFQWTDAGARDAAAPFLSNCVLTVAAGPKSQSLPLRAPVIGEPLPLGDLVKGFTGRWDIPNLPRVDLLKIEFSLDSDAFAHKFNPGADLSFKSPTSLLTFYDKEREEILGVKIDFAAKPRLQVTGNTFLKLATDSKELKLTTKLLTDRKKNMPTVEMINGNLQQLQTAIAQKKVDPDAGARLQEAQRLSLKAVNQFELAQEIVKAAPGLRLNVKLSYFADEKPVVLFSTEPL